MWAQTITLALQGELSIARFSKAISDFDRLVRALSDEVQPDEEIRWIVDDLQVGSATTTIRGESTEESVVAAVVEAYASVGSALREGAPIPFSEGVSRPALALTGLLNGEVEAIRFETAEQDYIIVSPQLHQRELPRVSFGAIEGRIQTVSNRGSLRFTLYDTLNDRAVSCYLRQGQEELLRDAWGHRARIEGTLSRDPHSDRPISIRQIQELEVLPELPPGSYRRARGAVKVPENSASPEEVIRRLRDAE